MTRAEHFHKIPRSQELISWQSKAGKFKQPQSYSCWVSRNYVSRSGFTIIMNFAILAAMRHCCGLPYGSAGNDIDIDGNYQGTGGGGANGRPIDYHTVVGHFKDFFMYLPVMMTTIKETMSGFPKFAEGMRILTSGKGRVDGEDCKCNQNSLGMGSSSEVLENSSRFR